MNKEQVICPITKLIFCDPVVAEDGYVYEYMAIRDWFKENDFSPVTKKKIGTRLMRVTSMKIIVEDLLDKEPHLRQEQFLFKKPFYLFKQELFDALLDNNANKIKEFTSICLTYEFRDTSLFEFACRQCSTDVLIYMFDNSIDQDVEDQKGVRPIHMACKYCKLDVVKHMVDNGVDLEAEDPNGCRPINYLLLFDDSHSIVKYLIEKNINLNTRNNSGFTPLAYIIIRGDIETFNSFLNNGVDLREEPKIGESLMEFVFGNSRSAGFIKYIIDIDDIFKNSITDKPEKCIYSNSNLTEDEQQELVFYYLNKMYNIPVIDEEYMDNLSDSSDYEDSDDESDSESDME